MEIRTAEGVVRGIAGRYINRWRGIPFAAPPVGDLRLRAPQPVRPWTGVRDAVAFGDAAIQPGFGVMIGPRKRQPMSENCLTLNVSVPAARSSSPRPVLVFIHGGGYLIGTTALGLYSGSRLAARGDVIYVSLNYRLGPLGYIDFGRFGTPARPFDNNLGLRDQVAALEWVRRNIAAFGGDPDNVTIFGESAGAGSVCALLATPAAKGLFHRAIAESAPADWMVDQDAADRYAHDTVAELGIDPTDTAAAITALGTVEPHVLRRASARAGRAQMRRRAGLPDTAPLVDGEYLPQSPVEAMRDGTAHRVPLIIGTNRHEATLFSRFDEGLPTDRARQTKLFAGADPKVIAQLNGAYGSYADGRRAVRLGGDYAFWRPTIEACEGHSAYAPTYNYRYDFAPPVLSRAGFGATHAWEMFAVFGYGDTAAGRMLTAGGRAAMRSLIDQVQGHWVTFARTGAPRPGWPSYTTDRRATLVFDKQTRVIDDIDQRRRLAWAAYRESLQRPDTAA